MFIQYRRRRRRSMTEGPNLTNGKDKIHFFGYLSLENQFITGNVQFLTVRGHQPKHQKIEFIRKMCAKIANTYLIVREKNKKGNSGYHFHVILKQVNKPNKSWFKKGLHINLKQVRAKLYLSSHTFSDRELNTMAFEDGEKGHTIINQLKNEKNVDREKRALKKLPLTSVDRTSVRKILNYMSKEAYMPIQYQDYIYIKSKKNVRLSDT